MGAIYDISGKKIAVSNGTRSIDISGIPCLHIVGQLPTSKDDGNVKVKYVFSNGTERFNGFATLKVQGNSTVNYPKKNFTLKLFSDASYKIKYNVSFNDWGEQNKYVLKADWIDISHSRNIVSARLWSDVVASRPDYYSLPELYRTSPNNCVIDGFIIKVYANGVYQGRYSLNIPKEPWMFNMDDSLDTHCVLCGEDYASSCFRAPANIDGGDWTDEIHEDNPPQALKTRWNEIISFIRTSSDENFKSGINNYINLNSLIDYYIFAYVDCGLDALGKNQIYLTYDGNLFYASMYDMDSTWGLYWNGSKFVSAEYRMQEDYEVGVHNTSNLLFDRLEKIFGAEIKARYTALREGVLSEAYIKECFKEWCDISPAELVAMDYAPETANGAFVDMPQKTTNNYEQLSSFVTARLAYVDGKIAELASVHLRYYNGSTLIHEEELVEGADGAWTGTATKSQDAQYTYTFAGWSKDDDNTVDADALTNVVADRNVYACFTGTLRKYTVYFVKASADGGGTLQTLSDVAYGTVITAASSYTGSTPTTSQGSAEDYPFEGWTPASTTVQGDTTFTAKFGSPVEVKEITDSWDTIIANIDNGTYSTKYKIGNYKPLDLGTEGTINMQIVAMDADELASGGKAPLTFLGMELLATAHRMNPAESSGAIGTGAIGGWENCEMRSYLSSSILPLINTVSVNVASRLQSVKKIQSNYINGGKVIDGQTTFDKLWIPSRYEIFAETKNETQGVEYTKIYKTNNNRKKKHNESYINWWLRSAQVAANFMMVASNGTSTSVKASESYPFTIGFCLGLEQEG